jgi:hypothetical protein
VAAFYALSEYLFYTLAGSGRRDRLILFRLLGDPVGLAELRVFSCERAAGFCHNVHHEDTAYFEALVRMFEQALEATANLTGNVQNSSCGRSMDVN